MAYKNNNHKNKEYYSYIDPSHFSKEQEHLYRPHPIDQEEFPRLVDCGSDWFCPVCNRRSVIRYESRHGQMGCVLTCLVKEQVKYYRKVAKIRKDWKGNWLGYLKNRL